jgi:hypothetical protein
MGHGATSHVLVATNSPEDPLNRAARCQPRIANPTANHCQLLLTAAITTGQPVSRSASTTQQQQPMTANCQKSTANIRSPAGPCAMCQQQPSISESSADGLQPTSNCCLPPANYHTNRRGPVAQYIEPLFSLLRKTPDQRGQAQPSRLICSQHKAKKPRVVGMLGAHILLGVGDLAGGMRWGRTVNPPSRVGKAMMKCCVKHDV